MQHPLQRGFTLVELMLVVLVIAVLAAVAYPSYQDAVRKGRRSEAFAALSQVQQAQERWRSNRPTFNDNLSALPTADPAGLGIAATTAPGGYYALSLGGVTATGYNVFASGNGSEAADDDCRYLQVQVRGGNILRGTGATTDTFSAANRCWPQ